MSFPSFLSTIPFFKKFSPGVELAPGRGRASSSESVFDGTNPDSITEQNEGLDYFHQISLDPYIAAALQWRDISRLWISAKGLEPNEQGAYSPPQILPFDDSPLSLEVWEFVTLNFDSLLERGMQQVIYQIQQSYMEYGRAVQELMPEFDSGLSKWIIADLKDRDPDRFIIDPPYMPPGIYLKKSIYNTMVGHEDRLPDYKFCVIANKPRFENRYGRSELDCVVDTEYGKRQVKRFWERHLEKHGSPQINATYPPAMAGEQHERWRDNQEQSLLSASHQAVIFHDERVAVETLEGKGDSEGFPAYTESREREISIALCGSATALQEGKYGSFSREEATTTRRKTEKEQFDAAQISDAFSYTIIPYLCDLNWMGLPGYPTMQIIPPELINPTQSEAQTKGEENSEEREEIEVQGGDEQTQKPNGEQGQEDLKTFQDQEEEPKKKIKTAHFPATIYPDQYDNKDLQKAAQEFMVSQPVMVRKDFDDKGGVQSRAFTITALKGNIGTITALHNAIKDTLSIPNERDAWEQYKKKASAILKENKKTSGISTDELITSFRMARQQAYVIGSLELANKLANDRELHGLQYHTQDDSDVRVNHRKMDNAIRPLDDPIWESWLPPNGFGCRCWIEPITEAQAKKDKEKYQYTEKITTLKPDKGFED